jgi:hypothetical protein
MTPVEKFFFKSELLDYLVLRPLSHIKGNWDLTYDGKEHFFTPEENSFAEEINQLLIDLNNSIPPNSYHDNEDCLAEYVKANLNWNIEKNGSQWEGAEYKLILEQGGFDDSDQQNLLVAAAGRIKVAIDYNQLHFDDMGRGHQNILAYVLSIILYHRS